MAKGEKRISINALERVMKDNFEKKTIVQWFDLDITIKKNLSLKEMLTFADDVAASCFNETGGFMPEIMDFAVRSNILTRYANFSLPDNLETRYDLLYNTDAVECVLQHINMNQLNELISATNRKIDHMCRTDVIGIQKKIERVIDAFEEMEQNTNSMFNGVKPEDFSKLMEVMAEHGKIDEKKIVDALMEYKEDSNDGNSQLASGNIIPIIKQNGAET